MNAGDRGSEERGLRLHHPSGNMGQGVNSRGELKGVSPEGAGKPISPQLVRPVRDLVLIGRQSRLLYPKPRDLALARMKWIERSMEVRPRTDVQFVWLSWG